MNENNGYSNNNVDWIIFLIFILAFGGNGFGFGGGNAAAQGALTRADFNAGLEFNNLQRQAEQNAQNLAQSTYDLRSALDKCCCETNRNIDSVKNEICNQTNALTNAIHAEGEATRALINANQMQELRDRNEALREQNASLRFDISQNLQTSNILNTLGRYVTNPPCPPNPCCPCQF